MKKIILVLVLIGFSVVNAQEQNNSYKERLENVFEQKTPGSGIRQLVYANLELVTAVSLNTLVVSRNAAKVKRITQEIRQLEKIKTAGPVETLSNRSKIASLKNEVQRIEKQLLQKSTSKTLKFFARSTLRGTQIFLVIEVGTRYYIVNALDRDPGYMPLVEIACEAMSCEKNLHKSLEEQGFDAINGPDSYELEHQH